MHLEKHEAYCNAYYGTRHMSISKLEKCLTIIHDKMDHAKMVSPCFTSTTKSIDVFMQFSVSITGMVVHGHRDVKFAHFSLDLYPGDSNCTNGSLAKLLRDLEKPPVSFVKSIMVSFVKSIICEAPLFDVVLKEKEVCIKSLVISLSLILRRRLPPILHVQLDNCLKDNKNRYLFYFWSILVAKGIFEEVFVSLLVEHIHEDIDTTFER